MEAKEIDAALHDIAAEPDEARKISKLKDLSPEIPSIPIGGVISYEDWLKGRRFRRELCKLAAPGINRRKSSSSDRRLKKLFEGEQGLPFTPTDKL